HRRLLRRPLAWRLRARPLRNTANSNLAAAGQAEPLRNANARRLLGGRHGHSRSHSRTGEESSARLQLKALRAVLRSRGAVSRQIVSRAAEAAALTGSDEASLAGSNTVWDGVFTSLSPTDTGGVFGSLLFVLLLALGLFLCAESAQPNLHRSKQEMFVWAFVQLLRMVSELEKLAALELRLEASDSELEELAAAYPEKIGSAWKLQPVRLEQRRLPANTGQKQQAVEQQEQQGNRQQEQQQLASNSEAIVKTPPPGSRPARRVRYRTEPPDDVAGRADGGVGGDSAGGGSGDCRPGSHSRTATRVSQAAAAGAAAAEAARLRMQPRWQTATAVTAAALALMPPTGVLRSGNLSTALGSSGVAGRPARVLPSLVLLGDALLNDPLRLQHVCLRTPPVAAAAAAAGGNSGSVVFAGPLGKMKAAAPGSPPPPPGVTNWLEKSFEAATAPAAPSFIGGGGGGTCRAESEPCGRLYEFIGEATRGGIGVEGVEISGIWQRIWERYADARMKCGNETIKQCSDLRGHQRLHVEEAVVGQGGHGAHDFIRGRLRVAALTQGGPQGISRDLRELLRRAGGILRGAQAELLLRQAAPACWGRRLLRRAGAARQRVGAAGGVRAGHGPGDVRVADVRTTGRLRVLGDLRHDHCRGRPVGLRVARDGDAALRQGLVLRLLRHLHECAAGVHDLLDEGALLADDHPGCAVRHQDLQLEQCGGGRVQTAMMESTVPWMRQTRSVVPGS
uniref:DUSP domain-containing protein n=1 Tax=Macrostomum lignano TaxID=282301 RepID=A0A1I8G855_9PLAT